MPISLSSVSYGYSGTTSWNHSAISDVSIELGEGEFIGLTGAPGSGKSTLIKLAAGLIRPDKGSVTLDGEDINARRFNKAILRSRLGVVLQCPEMQLFSATAEQEAAYVLKGSKLTSEETATAVQSAMESVGLDYHVIRNRAPMSLSAGERMKLSLASVLAGKPRILLLDEPLAGLDGADRETLLKLLDSLNKDGVTILMATDDGDALAEHAGRILAMRDGRIVREGKALKFFSDYKFLADNALPVPKVREAAELLGLPKRTVSYKQLLTGLKIVCGGGR